MTHVSLLLGSRLAEESSIVEVLVGLNLMKKAATELGDTERLRQATERAEAAVQEKSGMIVALNRAQEDDAPTFDGPVHLRYVTASIGIVFRR